MFANYNLKNKKAFGNLICILTRNVSYWKQKVIYLKQ